MDKNEVKYRGYTISYWAKPIPIRNFDWDFVHDDYDGPGDLRCGSAPSVEAAKAEIDEKIADEESE